MAATIPPFRTITKAPAMAPGPADQPPAEKPSQPWSQTSFLGEDVVPGATAPPTRVVIDALGAADHAGDARTRRVALDRLAASLTDQARQRGRTPVPKRGS